MIISYETVPLSFSQERYEEYISTHPLIIHASLEYLTVQTMSLFAVKTGYASSKIYWPCVDLSHS